MADHKFQIRTDGDECEEIWLDGVRLMSTNHDEQGWDGMEAVRKVVKAIAVQLGAVVTEDVPIEFDEG